MQVLEDKILSDCFIWHHNTFPDYRGCLFHVPNEGKRGKIGGAIMKAKGLIPGVSDFVLMHKGMFYALECKTENGKQSPNQKKWQHVCEKNGTPYHIFTSLDEFKKIIYHVYELS